MRRVIANLRYLQRPVLGFVPLLLGTGLVVLLGGICFHQWYDAQELSFRESLYLTYCLIFMEHLYPYPSHWGLQAFYWILPPLGLVVVLDGILRFSYHLLNRDQSGREWVRAMSQGMKGHVVLCGLGKLGIRVLQQLEQLKQDVVVMERDPLCPNIAYARKHGICVLIGTGREEGILADLNVGAAKSIILATNDDLANLEIALDARTLNPQIHVVLRMFDQELASKVRGSFDIPLAFSTSALAAPLFATSSSDASIVNSFYVGDRLLVVAQLEIRPDSELAGQKVRDLRVIHQIFVISHARHGETSFYPEGDRVLEVGDHVTLQTEPRTLALVHQWNGDR